MYYLIGYVMYIALTIGVLFYLLVYRSHISLLWKKVWTSITLVGVLIFTILCTSFLPFHWINILFYLGVILSYILIFSGIYIISSYIYNYWQKRKGQQTEKVSWKAEIEQLRINHQKKKNQKQKTEKNNKTSSFSTKRRKRETPLFVEREKVAKEEKSSTKETLSIQEEIKQWSKQKPQKEKKQKERKAQPIKAVAKQKQIKETVDSSKQVVKQDSKRSEQKVPTSTKKPHRPKNIQDYAPKMNTTSKIQKPKAIKKFNHKK